MALGGGLAGMRFLPRDPTQQAEAPQALDLAAVRDGLDAIVGLADHQQPAGTPLVQLALLGLVGAALPGPRWGIRLLLAAVGLIAAGLTASTVGELLRPRYLLAAMLPAGRWRAPWVGCCWMGSRSWRAVEGPSPAGCWPWP